MARIRTIKPMFFQHERLFEIGKESSFGPYVRIAYAGLWTQSDCRGLFEWRPLRLKLGILPWDDVDFGAILELLQEEGFVVRYSINGKDYGWIRSFSTHQRPHKHEIDAGPQFPEPKHLPEYAQIYYPETPSTCPSTKPGTCQGTYQGTLLDTGRSRSESGVLSLENGDKNPGEVAGTAAFASGSPGNSPSAPAGGRSGTGTGRKPASGPTAEILAHWDRTYEAARSSAYVRTAEAKERAAALRLADALDRAKIPRDAIPDAMTRFHRDPYWGGKGLAAFVEQFAQFATAPADVANDDRFAWCFDGAAK